MDLNTLVMIANENVILKILVVKTFQIIDHSKAKQYILYLC